MQEAGRIDRSADPQHEERRCVSCRWGVSTFRLYFTSSPYNYDTVKKLMLTICFSTMTDMKNDYNFRFNIHLVDHSVISNSDPIISF